MQNLFFKKTEIYLTHIFILLNSFERKHMQ